MPAPHRLALAATVLALSLVAAGCAERSSASPGGDPTPASPTPMPTTGELADPIDVDLRPGGSATTLGNGWTVRHCEGDAPLLCVRTGDGDVLGTVEFGSYPLTDEIAQALESGNLFEALEERVAEQQEWVETDRAEGCGQEYAFHPEPARRTTVGGEPAVAYGFSGIVDGLEIERHRAYYAVHDGQLWVINAAAAHPDGCMTLGMGEFLPVDLITFDPYLQAIAEGFDLAAAGSA